MIRPAVPAEHAYLNALDLEADGRTGEALEAYQSVIDNHGQSLWSDSARQAMDRIAEGVPVSARLSQARRPFGKRFTRSLSFPHALITAVMVIVQAITLGPLVAGSWIVIVVLDLSPMVFIYAVGGLPAALAGLFFAVWVLGYCHRRGYMPERVILAGIVCGSLAVAFSGWVLVPLMIGDVLPVGIVIFLIVHGMAGGAFMGWLGGKVAWYRMDRDTPPFSE